MRKTEFLTFSGFLLMAAGGLLCPVHAEQKPPEPIVQQQVTVKLVSDFETGKLVSDLEDFQPVTEAVFDERGSSTVTLGERVTLWVRNAHIDQQFFFEKYHQGKYIGRDSRLDAKLSPGEHVIQPGDHNFRLADDGGLSSDDPDIRIQGRTVMLRLHKVTVYGVDGSKTGPPEFRKVPADVGLLSMAADFRLDPESLPDPRQTYNPQNPPQGKDKPVPPLTNMLSHQKQFYPLSVWLPANQAGQGYVLYPSWQAFHLKADGNVDIVGNQAPPVPGVEVDGSAIVIPYRRFQGKLNSRTGLKGGVGSVNLSEKMDFSATLERMKFRAGLAEPPEDFYLSVDNDLSRKPHKFFLADNGTADANAVRLLALEWDKPVYTRGSEASVSLRLLESAGKETFRKPEVRMSYSPYSPSDPLWRLWKPVDVLGWQNGQTAGELRFRAPDIDFSFVCFRAHVFEAGEARNLSPLSGEIQGAVIQPGQTGTASFVTNKGRNAFVAGEEIQFHLVIRSAANRPPGPRSVVLTHPDGSKETLEAPDSGDPWAEQSFCVPGERSLRLQPGRYVLSVSGLPDGVVALPFAFDLVGRQKPSLYHVAKTSKYTRPMNMLETSHLQGEPVDLDRAMQTIAELGYNRVDLMSYITNHHLRAYTWREDLAASDARLPTSEAVYTPTPRNQILNACVRNQLRYSDVWLTYNDFHLPRYIDGYIRASERWLAREIQAMRHSAAMDGAMLYDEMYQGAVTGIVKTHQKLFANIRARLASDTLGKSPAKIEEAMNRYLERPRSQRDPETLRLYIRYKDWEQHGWADYVNRVVKVGKELAPHARFGTYHRTWAGPGTNDDIYNGYPPDLFKNLDIISHVHYADNCTCWVSIPLLAQALRTGQGKTLYVNMPILHECRTQWDGQYQRQMAFALLAQGANGIAQWATPHTFEDGPNPGTAIGKETTRYLNAEILQPFGEIIDRTADGCRKVGIVSTFNQHALSQFKDIPTAHQTEGLWIACWRLGYPATFLREEHLRQKLEGFQVIFVPGIRFDGELEDFVTDRLREAIAAGTRVVVEQGSVLDLPGITKLDDWALNSYYVGGTYFATWRDDELNKVYEKSQPIVDYLAPKLKEWDIEPAARGQFKVGPTWRDGGDVDYLVMANFDDPDYGHTVRQQMAKPGVTSLRIPAHHGSVAYDLLAQRELKLEAASDGKGRPETSVDIDMRRVQGALVAFLPERVGKLRVTYAVSANSGTLRLQADLVGASGKPMDAVFPVRIALDDGQGGRTFYRVFGRGIAADIDLPQAAAARSYAIEVREAISGQSARFQVPAAVRTGASLQLVGSDAPHVPYPDEVRAFLENAKAVTIVPAKGIAGIHELAEELARKLAERGVKARVVDEQAAHHLPEGDPEAEDPLNDGFHSWRAGQEIIGPATVVDDNAILMGGAKSLFLLDTLAEYGCLTVAPVGGPGQKARPSIQVARKGLHHQFDTLCLIANDAQAMRRSIDCLFGALPKAQSAPTPSYGEAKAAESPAATPVPPATDRVGNNEMVLDIQFDKAGNLYVITWGHGKNLYSFTSEGKPRFSRFLPEMGTNRLEVYDDRLFAYTCAGARLYELTLDGKPMAQARLNMNPGATDGCDNYELSWADYRYVPSKRQILHNMGARMRLLDEQFNILAEWEGEEYFDKDVAEKVFRRNLHGYVLSPDQQRIAQLESSFYYTQRGHEDVEVFDTHLVIRDLAGKLLHEYKNLDNGIRVEAHVSWPESAPGPVVHVKKERWAFDAALSVLSNTEFPGDYGLGGDRRLVRDGSSMVYYDSPDHEQCRIGPLRTPPTYARLSPDGQSAALLDEYGRLSLYRTADGALLKEFVVPEIGQVLSFTPDSKRLLLGTFRGAILAYGLDGSRLWDVRLADFNDILGQNLPLYDPSFPDYTEKLWPTGRDEPGELDEMVRMGVNRLANGDCETDGAWQGTAVSFHPEGSRSKRSLKVGKEMVGQEVSQFLGKHVTWVLEFFYRAARPEAPNELLAGLMADSECPASSARRFVADSQWRFGRVVIKNGNNCRKLSTGFYATSGEVLVDKAELRQIRFPSINHLLYEPLHAIKPVILDNPLFSEKYDPCGNVREENPNRIIVEVLATGALNLIESAFLQNGRLNDTTSKWYIQPLGHDPLISCGLKEPRWVSMVALYFDFYDEPNLTPHFDIYATDMETQKDRLVASIRNNRQLFRLVKFPPVKTPLVRIRLVNSIARLRTLAEIELYGPLSGRSETPAFIEPLGQNTWMGDFSRVDKRPMKLAESYSAPIVGRGGYDEDISWYPPMAQILVSEGRLLVARALGKNSAFSLDDPTKELYRGRAGGTGYTPYGALYGGLLLRCGNDGKLYCLNPDSGTELWSVKLGERLFGCPVAIGEDVFVANESGRLFQVDLANGSIMKEAAVSGGLFGSLTTDGTRLFFITEDGLLHALAVADLRPLWEVKVAEFTDSTPAVDGGVVYLADQKGRAMAVEADSGRTRWEAALGDEFCRCPVVGKDRIVFGCRGGTLAVLNRADGKLAWSKKVESRFQYEPLLLEDRVLFFRNTAAMLADLADGKEKSLQWTSKDPKTQQVQINDVKLGHDPVGSIGYYGGMLFFVDRAGEAWHNALYMNFPWHVTGGSFVVMKPTPPEPTPKVP